MSTKVNKVNGSPKVRTDKGKLAYLLGMLEGTIGSICDYSAEALIDRMKLMAAYIRDDEKGMEQYGQLCHNEREELLSREGA